MRDVLWVGGTRLRITLRTWVYVSLTSCVRHRQDEHTHTHTHTHADNLLFLWRRARNNAHKLLERHLCRLFRRLFLHPCTLPRLRRVRSSCLAVLTARAVGRLHRNRRGGTLRGRGGPCPQPRARESHSAGVGARRAHGHSHDIRACVRRDVCPRKSTCGCGDSTRVQGVYRQEIAERSGAAGGRRRHWRFCCCWCCCRCALASSVAQATC